MLDLAVKHPDGRTTIERVDIRAVLGTWLTGILDPPDATAPARAPEDMTE